MLEDESGRIRLIGKVLEDVPLVTGVIVGVLGAETSSGDFEAVDLCFPGLAPQASEDDRMDVDGKHALGTEADKIALTTYPGHLQILTIASETNT